MSKMLVTVETNDESILGAIGRMDKLMFEMEREMRKIRSAIGPKEKASSESEPARED